MIAPELLESPCSENRLRLEQLDGPGLTPRQRRDLQAHLRICSGCRSQWHWVQWSNDLIRAALDRHAPIVDARIEVKRMLVERVDARLARALDQAGKRLLIASGGAQFRIVMGRVPVLRTATKTMEQQIRTLDELGASQSLRRFNPLLRRLWRCQPGSPASVKLADDVLRCASELDPHFPQPIIRRIQLAPPGQSLQSVERMAEEVLRLSPEPCDRSLVLVETSSKILDSARDLAKAESCARSAVAQDVSSATAALALHAIFYLRGQLTEASLEKSLRAHLRRTRSRYDSAYWARLSSVWRGCTRWLSALGLIDSPRSLASVMARVLS